MAWQRLRAPDRRSQSDKGGVTADSVGAFGQERVRSPRTHRHCRPSEPVPHGSDEASPPTVAPMDGAFPGLGTVINVGTIVVGSLLGMAAGHRLPERTRSVAVSYTHLRAHETRHDLVCRL